MFTMRNLCLRVLFISLLISCKSKSNNSELNTKATNIGENVIDYSTSDDIKPREYNDGEYCASVEYYNASTGTSSIYTLQVQVEDGELVQINWPNGGWLDSSHFSTPELEADGSCSFSTDDGKDYDVQLIGSGGCNVSNSSPMMKLRK